MAKAKFAIMASELKSLKKSMEDRKLAELKKEIIEILKKQDEKDFKKAIDYFESQELHFTHLEKSLVSGKWIEKAGYGVGTVRIWKGKKYKKIAPGKWARVFDKESKGANVSIGRLIAEVDKIQSIEKLYEFAMAHKQRFVDDNGIDLPILDKLRAKVDSKNEELSNGNVGSKEKTVEEKIKENPDYPFKPKTDKERAERAAFEKDRDDFIERMDKIRQENKADKKTESSKKIEVKLLSKEEMKKMTGDKLADYRHKLHEEMKKFDYGDDENFDKVYEVKKIADDIFRNKEYARNGEPETKEKVIDNTTLKFDDNGNINEVKSTLIEPSKVARNFKYNKDKLSIDELKNAKVEIDLYIQKLNDEISSLEKIKKDNSLSDKAEKTLDGNIDYYKNYIEAYSKDKADCENLIKESETEKHQNRSDAMKGNKNAYKGGKVATSNPEKLKPIDKSESIEEGKVKIPYSKEIADEIKQLTNSVAKIKLSDTRYAMMNKVYYDKGNLVATDGKCMKIIKVGELSGIDNGTYVDIDNSKDGITITADKEFTKEHKFPQYERVLPQDNKEKIVLDNKALISKIKDLKKDGSISNKDSFVTFDIQGNDLMLDGVKVGDVSAANFEGEDSNYFNIDSNLLTKYLSGDYSELMSSKDNSKAMYLGNDSAINIIMPQTKYEYNYDSSGNQKREIRRKDYDSRRKDKEFADEAKSNKKAAQKMANQGYVDDVINGYKRTVPADFEEKSIKKIQDWDLGTLQNMYKIANADIDHLMETKDLQSNSFMSFTNKEFGCSPRHVIGQNYAMKEHPAIVREIERLIKEKGGKIEKSLFDDFIIDVFAADDEEELEEELYAGETEYNDYSAEQPELFNSTAMKVREAMDRIRNQVL